MKRLRVLVVDDSAICRAELRHIVEKDGDIAVVGEASDGGAVLALVERHRPDLLLVDLQMPGVDGLATVERVMATLPLPILVVTGRPEGRDRDTAFEAIRRGALDLAEKPAFDDRRSQATLRSQVRQLSTVPVIRHVAGGGAARAPRAEPKMEVAPRTFSVAVPVVGVAASAGGPAALVAFLKEFPKGFPACFAVVQHLPDGFAPAFAQYLEMRSRLAVRVGADGTDVTPGVVVVAPDERHLVLRTTGQFGLDESPRLEGHRPSATVLLSSLARVFGGSAIGIVLSGIGQDGVQGLLELRRRGALTLAQDERTSAVYGMPRAAYATGAAAQALDPSSLARAVANAVGADLRGGKP